MGTTSPCSLPQAGVCGTPTSCAGSCSRPNPCSGWKEKLAASEERNRRLTSAIRRLEAEAVRLRKILVDSWGYVPGEELVVMDSKEV